MPKKISGSAGLNFSPEDISFLDEVGDTIIPAIDTPGAKDAKIGDFMHTIVRDCYDEKQQKIFMDGMAPLNQSSKQKNGKYFLESSPAERKALLIELDKEQMAYTAKKKPDDPPHYFRMMKELTIWGYFTSEPEPPRPFVILRFPAGMRAVFLIKKATRPGRLSFQIISSFPIASSGIPAGRWLFRILTARLCGLLCFFPGRLCNS